MHHQLVDDYLLVNVSLTFAIAQSSFFSSISVSSYVSSVPLRQSLIEMHSLTIRRGWSIFSISLSVSAFSSLSKRISINNFCNKSSSTSFHLDTSVTLPKIKDYIGKLYTFLPIFSYHKYRSWFKLILFKTRINCTCRRKIKIRLFL